ncbi:hypothetical protein L0V05_20315 [Tabrizicola sp. J26]|uniref:hypothetical protein n=1 Tax=Alitabrizicola rongguiensis TaxID=2909234 RepID=UPI001F286C80|nr:hypothetical protein [Tabrizicola rongguiensis]MCF1711155.1 hypothetical protein [Tabrizicola rongguiensis]
MIARIAQFSLCLCLSVALAMLGMSSAKAEIRMGVAILGLTAMVICSDGDSEMIFVDNDGNPATPPDHGACSRCPDCLSAGAVFLSADRPDITFATVIRTTALAEMGTRLPALHVVAIPMARGPPVWKLSHVA